MASTTVRKSFIPGLSAGAATAFVARSKAFADADANAIPILHLKKPDRSRWDDRKRDHARPYLERADVYYF